MQQAGWIHHDSLELGLLWTVCVVFGDSFLVSCSVYSFCNLNVVIRLKVNVNTPHKMKCLPSLLVDKNLYVFFLCAEKQRRRSQLLILFGSDLNLCIMLYLVFSVIHGRNTERNNGGSRGLISRRVGAYFPA